MDSQQIIAALKEPFDPNVISWRPGTVKGDRALALAYIDARDVMKRLDDVLGCENWQDSYTETPKGRLICTLSVRLNGEWIAKSDGAGDTHVEAEKGAISDAFKRAAVKWGVGRYLYYLDSLWCDIDQHKRITNPPQLPSWALPKQAKKSPVTGPVLDSEIPQ